MTGDVEPPPSSLTPLHIGRMLAGRYRLHDVLGEGGMAVVYEGEHLAIGKRVAIKLVQSIFANDTEIVDRFEREARSASAVESEHIVHVFDVGADPELGLFLVMELLKGEDLGRVLTRRPRLDPVFVCGLVKQAALGLEKAHAAGIVHRDLKPANVFLVQRDDGTTLVKLVDFGIAKVLREAHDSRFSRKGITRRGTAIGTPQYMSPEQAQGLETVDHRTDVYSLGAVIFEAIAGVPCVEERATYEQTILSLVSTTAPRLRDLVPGIPEALDVLVAEMLEHDLDRRVSDMRTVRQRIEGIYPELMGSTVTLRSLPPPSAPGLVRIIAADGATGEQATVHAPPRPRRASRRVPVVLTVAALAAAIGAGAGFIALGARGAVATGTGSGAGAPSASASVSAPAGGRPGASSSAPGPGPTAAASTSATTRTASVPAAGSTSAKKPVATHSAPSGSAGGAAQASPAGQVGAAGISNQF